MSCPVNFHLDKTEWVIGHFSFLVLPKQISTNSATWNYTIGLSPQLPWVRSPSTRRSSAQVTQAEIKLHILIWGLRFSSSKYSVPCKWRTEASVVLLPISQAHFKLLEATCPSQHRLHVCFFFKLAETCLFDLFSHQPRKLSAFKDMWLDYVHTVISILQAQLTWDFQSICKSFHSST